MNCRRCGTELQVGLVGTTCPVCRSLLSNPDIGLLASPGQRLGAYLLDMVIWGPFNLVAVFLISTAEDENWGLVSFGFLLILGMLVLSLYFWAKSTSLGKWLLGLRVYRTTGTLLGFWMMLVRETIGKLISGSLLGIGFLWLLWDRDNQCFHDKIAGSVVMNIRSRALNND